MAREIRNAEDLEAAILADELADAHELAAEGLRKMTVREYAKYKKEQPQLIYYYIRQRHINLEQCVCGRSVIDVAGADAYLAQRDAKKRTSS